MQCDKCRREAIIFQPYSGRHLCKEHFLADAEAKAKRVIRSHQWLRPGDHVAVALSGDKKSSALLFFLKKLTGKRSDIRVSAIFIDEGIRGHHDSSRAREVANALETECHTGSLQEEFGITVDSLAKEKGCNSVCNWCRTLRDTLLMKIASEKGATTIAKGRSLDENALSTMEFMLQGEPEQLVTSCRGLQNGISWIEPFSHIPADEVNLYADLKGVGFPESACSYGKTPLRQDVKILLEGYTASHPATRYAVANLGETLAGYTTPAGGKVLTCRQCGSVISGTCRACEIRDGVKRRGP
jgi:tRNA(Ile)-lysidine synthase TilS/MesJ